MSRFDWSLVPMLVATAGLSFAGGGASVGSYTHTEQCAVLRRSEETIHQALLALAEQGTFDDLLEKVAPPLSEWQFTLKQRVRDRAIDMNFLLTAEIWRRRELCPD